MPTIAELIQAELDRGPFSYGDLSRRSGNALGIQQLQKLVKGNPKEFPEPRTIEQLARLLEVPVTTILMAFAKTLSLPISESRSALETMLPPGTERLTDQDVDAIRAVVKALLAARAAAAPPAPDLAQVEGLRLAEDDSAAHDGSNTPKGR